MKNLLPIAMIALVVGCATKHGITSSSGQAQGTVIKERMSIETARKALEGVGVELEEDVGDYSRNPWVVFSAHSVDALVFAPDDRMRVRGIYWYVDWKHDRGQPKGLRKSVHEDVSEIAVEAVRRWVETGIRPE